MSSVTPGTSSGSPSTSTTTTSAAGVPIFASSTDDWIAVKVHDPKKPGQDYVSRFARMPVYFDTFQHTPSSPMINVQYVIWSPGDADASVTIHVG